MDVVVECPVCHTGMSIDMGVAIKPKLITNKDGKVIESRRISKVEIRGVEPLETAIARILIRIQSYIHPDMTINELAEVLEDEYRVCPAHIPMMVERIKEGYGLYSPDGKTLEKIN